MRHSMCRAKAGWCPPRCVERSLHATVAAAIPAATTKRFVDAHHIVHWADGGDTTLDNLTQLCRKHHRYLHECGYQLKRVGRELRFLRPDGKSVPDVPRLPPCDSDHGCEALREANANAIDSTTAVSHWNGQSPRYDWLVALMQQRSPRRQPTGTLHMKRPSKQEAFDLDSEPDMDELDEEGQQMLRDQQLSAERSRRAFLATW